MKHLSRLLLASLFVFGLTTSVSAQSENNPWAVSIGTNAVDTYPAIEDNGLFDGFSETKDWNFLPSVSRLSIARYIGSGFSAEIAGSINRIDNIGGESVDDLMYYSVDGGVNYSFRELINKEGWFDPFLGVGGGYTWIDEIGNGTVNGTLGFNFWFNENIAFNIQTTYKEAFEDDGDDNCPDEAGPVENNGCPFEDRDNDGVLDKDDQCPDVAGTEANNGCPQVSVEIINELNEYSKTILFDLNKASIRKDSYGALESIAEIMNEYPNTVFHIEGHTDSSGRDAYNLELSKKRAASVRDYLVNEEDIESSRVTSEGYGETQPIATNKTDAGRQKNRRVEVSLEKNRDEE